VVLSQIGWVVTWRLLNQSNVFIFVTAYTFCLGMDLFKLWTMLALFPELLVL
jgi:hypothetical protein